jgi:nucleotide-binding universal stress UspA family protein
MKKEPNLFSLKKILVATDFSTRAEKALARAAQLAEEHKAALAILYVQHEAARHGETEARQVAAEVQDNLRRKVQGFALPHDGPATTQVVAGKPFVKIIQRARDEAADLIVTGAHRAHIVADLFLRTTAENIMRKGDRPLLVVKRTTRGPYRRVLVPVDFSDNSRHALELALRLAPRAEFHVMHAYEGVERQLWRADVGGPEIMRYRRQLAKTARQEMKTFLDSIDYGSKRVGRGIWYGQAPHMITLVAQRLEADLVVVGTAGRTGLRHVLLGSVAEHVIREVSSDVLVLPSGYIR